MNMQTLQSDGSGDLARSGDARMKASGTGNSVGGESGVDAKDPGSYTVARHVADFGNVVIGFTKTKAFRVVNTGKVKMGKSVVSPY